MEPVEGHGDVQFEWYRGFNMNSSQRTRKRFFEAGFFDEAIIIHTKEVIPYERS